MKISELKPLEKNPFKSSGDEQIKLIIVDRMRNLDSNLVIKKNGIVI